MGEFKQAGNDQSWHPAQVPKKQSVEYTKAHNMVKIFIKLTAPIIPEGLPIRLKNRFFLNWKHQNEFFKIYFFEKFLEKSLIVPKKKL